MNGYHYSLEAFLDEEEATPLFVLRLTFRDVARSAIPKRGSMKMESAMRLWVEAAQSMDRDLPIPSVHAVAA